MTKEVVIYTDGGSRGNPGNSASAFVILDKNGKVIQEYSEFIGNTTNNVAEYTAMIKALEFAKSLRATDIIAYSDSELMIKQLNGEYKVKKTHLQELNTKIKNLVSTFKSVKFSNVPRENNMVSKADKLVNECLDRNQGSIHTLSRGL